MEKLEKFNGIDVTDEYLNMIHSFECDFNLIEEGFDVDFRRMFVETKSEFLKDVELLRKLCFDLRHGFVKIVEVKDSKKE